MGYHQGVKKRCLLILLSIILLFSCSTVKTDGVSESASEVVEGEKVAVTELLGDMLDSLDTASLTPDDIASSLDESYTIYSSYLPAYDNIKERYLDSVISIFGEGVLSALVESVGNITPTLIGNVSRYFSGEAVTPDIEKATRSAVVTAVTSDTRYRELLAQAAEESSINFNNVRKAYSILSLVGKEIELPEIALPSMETLINLILDKYYSLLSDAEDRLRDNPFYGNEGYSLFWGDKNG